MVDVMLIFRFRHDFVMRTIYNPIFDNAIGKVRQRKIMVHVLWSDTFGILREIDLQIIKID